MTDFTTDIAREEPRKVTPPKREYYAYFALIFVVTLPLALLTWALKALRTGSMPDRNPVSSAWSQARIITPQIFHG